MAEKVTITVDALGGDDAPGVVLDGVAQALAADPDLSVILCGPAEVVEPFAASHERAEARATTEFIAMDEHPANAVRRKKDSSLVVGCRLVKEGAADGFFSAGSTGACLAAATLVMGRVKGVKRPALGQVLPAYGTRPTPCAARRTPPSWWAAASSRRAPPTASSPPAPPAPAWPPPRSSWGA